MLDESAIQRAIQTTVAKEILTGLDSDVRDHLLIAAITKALTDYRFTGAVADTVAARAQEVAAELCETDEWTTRIRETIEEGFDDYLIGLRKALPVAIHEMLHGTDNSGSYGRVAGLILKHLSK